MLNNHNDKCAGLQLSAGSRWCSAFYCFAMQGWQPQAILQDDCTVPCVLSISLHDFLPCKRKKSENFPINQHSMRLSGQAGSPTITRLTGSIAMPINAARFCCLFNRTGKQGSWRGAERYRTASRSRQTCSCALRRCIGTATDDASIPVRAQ